MSSTIFGFVGGYTSDSNRNGIYSILISPLTGELRILNNFEVENVSFFAQSGSYLYAVSEGDPPHSRLWRVRIKPTEPYKLIDSHHVELAEKGACYLHVTELSTNQRRIAVAFYSSGAVQFLNEIDGKIEAYDPLKFTDFTNHDPSRQEMPHSHCVVPINGSENYYVVDLGADCVYLVKPDTVESRPAIVDSIQLPRGSGPRHVLQHPENPLLFILSELENNLSVYKIESDQKFTFVEKHSTLVTSPTDFIVDDEIQNAAHLAITECGNYVLCSNRGKMNNIVVYRIEDPKNGNLKLYNAAGTGGHFPRYFTIYQNLLIVANQLSHNLVAFRFEDGQIKEKLGEIAVKNNPVAIHVYNPPTL